MSEFAEYLLMSMAMGITQFDMGRDYLPNKKHKGELGNVRNSQENPKICRNALCPCNSGKKYKKCCM